MIVVMCCYRASQSAADSGDGDEQQEQGDPNSTQQSDWSHGLQGAAGAESAGAHGNVAAQHARWLTSGPDSGNALLHLTYTLIKCQIRYLCQNMHL